MIRARGLTKKFGAISALSDVDVDASAGQVLGLLGHNGAGKTTLIRILATLSPATAGTAEVAGFDVRADASEVRRRIGLTGQFAALDEHLSGVDNLILVGRLLGASRREARVRANELIEALDLGDAAHRLARTYSGGMKRRLDLAASMLGHPDVLFLDEPTTGLDPVSRSALWDIVRGMAFEGTTVLLTTQYLEEVDRLADRVNILDGGRVVAHGSPAELKAALGSRSVRLAVPDTHERQRIAMAVERAGCEVTDAPGESLLVLPVKGVDQLLVAIRVAEECGVALEAIELSEPTLEDVFREFIAQRPAREREKVVIE